MPYYPIYGTNRNLNNQFIENHGGNLDEYCLSKTTFMKLSDNSEINYKNKYTLAQGMSGITINLDEKDIDEIEYITVFSDGICQIKDIKWEDAVVDFLNFKNTKGEFLKRRMMRQIRDYENNGNYVLDDISCSIIRIEKD